MLPVLSSRRRCSSDATTRRSGRKRDQGKRAVFIRTRVVAVRSVWMVRMVWVVRVVWMVWMVRMVAVRGVVVRRVRVVWMVWMVRMVVVRRVAVPTYIPKLAASALSVA